MTWNNKKPKNSDEWLPQCTLLPFWISRQTYWIVFVSTVSVRVIKVVLTLCVTVVAPTSVGIIVGGKFKEEATCSEWKKSDIEKVIQLLLKDFKTFRHKFCKLQPWRRLFIIRNSTVHTCDFTKRQLTILNCTTHVCFCNFDAQTFWRTHFHLHERKATVISIYVCHYFNAKRMANYFNERTTVLTQLWLYEKHFFVNLNRTSTLRLYFLKI